jgi:hypothetical protein
VPKRRHITRLEKDGPNVFLSAPYTEKNHSVELKIPRTQLIKLIDHWNEIVSKHKPKEVIIIYDKDQFTIETRD